MRKKISENIIFFIVVLIFFMAGFTKFTGNENQLIVFEKAGYSIEFYYTIGILEILGASGLLIPKFRISASIGLMLIMVGAFFTQIKIHDYMHCLNPLFFIMFLLLLKRNWLKNSSLTHKYPIKY